MWVGIITLIVTNTVTLTTSIFAYTKEEKEATAKAAYAELSQAVSNISKENVALHKDVANIRGYLSGLAEKKKHQHEHSFKEARARKRHGIRPQIREKVIQEEEEEIAMEEPPQMEAKPKKYSPPSLDALQQLK